MALWPDLYLPGGFTVTPYSQLASIGGPLLQVNFVANSAASAVYPTANVAIYIPFIMFERGTIAKMFTNNGATASGNVDVGIYDEYGTRLVSMGSTAQAGTNALQTYDVTDTVIGPGLFYMGIAVDNTTGTLISTACNAEWLRTMGVFQEASAFPLPAVATFATMATAYVPAFGALINRSTI